jgi:hypothetical protein
MPKDFLFPGFGHVRMLPASLDIDKTKEAIEEELSAPNGPGELASSLASSSESSDLIEVKPNVPLLFGFMGLFAIIVGPVNVFALARRRRGRLFWTTPFISLCASALLIGMIVAQDGLGGHGVRGAEVCLFPQSRNAVVMQEQVSRVGLLLDSSFQTRDPVFMRQLELPARENGPARGRELRNEGTSYAKGWFVSRAAQAQRIVAVVPTRAEITLLNAADVRDKGDAPVIVSGFDTTLDTLSYTDGQHRNWQGQTIRTGQKQTLESAPENARPFEVTEALRLLAVQPGYFRATASHGADYVTTLGSIHWTDQPVNYVGPVTTAP